MNRTFRITSSVLASLSLASILACGGGGGGGGSTATPASALAYTNPTSGTYQLVADASSTPTHLVLNLVGPSGVTLGGVGFYLDADPDDVTWSVISGGKYVGNTLFSSPVIGSKVTLGELQAGIYQKGSAAPQTTGGSSILATVALDLVDGTSAGKTVTFTAPTAEILNPPPTGASQPASTPITITVGTLVTE